MLEGGIKFTPRRSRIAKRRLITPSLRGPSDSRMEPALNRLITHSVLERNGCRFA
jgi:hypothetical protein